MPGAGFYFGGDWTAVKEAEFRWRLYYRGERFEGPFRSLTMIQTRVSQILKDLEARR